MPYPPGALFPARLHKLLEDAARQGDDDAISWSPEGKSFKVHDKAKFETKLMPRYFGSSKYRSFQKNLNLWEFKTVVVPTTSPRRGECSHPLFVRGKLELCKGMNRVVKSKCPKETPRSTSTTISGGTSASGIAHSRSTSPTHDGAPASAASAVASQGTSGTTEDEEALRLLRLVLTRSTQPPAASQQNNITPSTPALGEDDSPLVKHIRAAERRRNRNAAAAAETTRTILTTSSSAASAPPSVAALGHQGFPLGPREEQPQNPLASSIPGTAPTRTTAAASNGADDRFGALVSSLLSKTNIIGARDHPLHRPPEPAFSPFLPSPPPPSSYTTTTGGDDLEALVSSLLNRTNLGALSEHQGQALLPSAGRGTRDSTSTMSPLLLDSLVRRSSLTSGSTERTDVASSMMYSSQRRTYYEDTETNATAAAAAAASAGGGGGEDDISRLSRIVRDAAGSAAIMLLQEQIRRAGDDGYGPDRMEQQAPPDAAPRIATTTNVTATGSLNEQQRRLNDVLALRRQLTSSNAPSPQPQLRALSSSSSLYPPSLTMLDSPSDLLQRIQTGRLLLQAELYSDELSRIVDLLNHLNSDSNQNAHTK
jgi:hypothetical protein